MLTGPMPAGVEIASFASKTSVRPRIDVTTWPALAEALTRHRTRATKDGPSWSPTVYRRDDKGRPLTRKLAHVESVTCAVADIDHSGFDEITELIDHVKLLGLAGAIYSTFSHTVTAPRVRLIIPFTEPVPAELWPRLWTALNEHICLHLADRAASDASRMYFSPATPGGETTIADSWDGAALDWRALPLAAPETVPSSMPVVTEGTGPAETVALEDMPILERLFSRHHGEKRMRAWTGDYSDFDGNASSADQSIANGLVTYCKGNVERAERIMRAGAWRPKWDERRGGTTWLGYTLGKALAAYHAWVGTEGHQDAADEPDACDTAVPADETPEQRVARLERELAAERQAHAVTRSVNAVQQTRIRALVAELEQERALRAQDRRLTLAEQRLGRVSTYSSLQKEIIKTAAILAPALANTHQTDAPIITAQMYADAIGENPKTIGANLKVFDQPGSPIRRELKLYGLKKLTHYELTTTDPVAIIDAMVAVGEQLEARVSPRKRKTCPTCPEGTGTVVNIICEGCGELLEERHVAAPKDPPADNRRKNRLLETTTTPAMAVPVTLMAAKPPIARADLHRDDLAERRARDAQAIPLGRLAADEWKRPARPRPDPYAAPEWLRSRPDNWSDVEAVPLDDPPARPRPRPSRCDCGCYEYAAHRDGWRCLKCGAVYDAPLAAVAGGPE
jgi:hypothetical protein